MGIQLTQQQQLMNDWKKWKNHGIAHWYKHKRTKYIDGYVSLLTWASTQQNTLRDCMTRTHKCFFIITTTSNFELTFFKFWYVFSIVITSCYYFIYKNFLSALLSMTNVRLYKGNVTKEKSTLNTIFVFSRA